MFFEDVLYEADMVKVFDKKDLVVRFFSDNILLAIKIPPEDESRTDKLVRLLNIVGNIQIEILEYGYLVRGAIVEGDFYADSKFVYGRGLVDAVNIEENIAIYPRIIVQKNIQEVTSQYCYQDSDGEFYLNSFLYSSGLSYVGFKYGLLEMLKQCAGNSKIKQKIMWAIDYYNKYYSNPYSFNATGAPLITEKEIDDITTSPLM